MLPRLLPMLAVPAVPFDSAEHSFEIKWNGIRALAAVETTGWRLWGRQQADYTTLSRTRRAAPLAGWDAGGW